MVWLARHVVVGLEERFVEQGPDVAAAEPVDHPPPCSGGIDESGEAKFREMLAGDGCAASSEVGEGGDVEVLLA